MKFLVAIASCVVYLCVVKAYDFDDSVYNQILANELEELQWDTESHLLHARSRRDEEAVVKDDKCRRKRFRSCCDEDYFNSLKDDEKPLKKECYKQITGKELGDTPFDPFRCDRTEKHKRDIACVAQCVGQKKDLLDAEGNIKEVDARKAISEKMSKVEWLSPSSDGIVTKCIATAKEATAKRDSTDKDACNPAAVKFGHCLWREIQLACPADRIKDEKKCNKIREDIKKDLDTFPQQPGAYDD